MEANYIQTPHASPSESILAATFEFEISSISKCRIWKFDYFLNTAISINDFSNTLLLRAPVNSSVYQTRLGKSFLRSVTIPILGVNNPFFCTSHEKNHRRLQLVTPSKIPRTGQFIKNWNLSGSQLWGLEIHKITVQASFNHFITIILLHITR